MKQNGILSFSASIVYKNDIVWSKGYGKVNPLDEKSPPLTIDHCVRIGSITKVFTELMMFQLRDKGVLSLDDPISKFNPQFSIRCPYKTKREITFREIASHISGLPREVPCNFEDLPDKHKCSEKVVMERLAKMYLILPQYHTPHYSNLGFALLGRSLEKACDTKYERFVHEEILEPLGMFNSSFNRKKIQDQFAVGVTLYPNGSYVQSPVVDFGWGTPMGGLYSTPRDMSKFMSFWLNQDAEEGILDRSTINEAMSPLSLVNDGVSLFGSPFELAYNQKNNIWVKSKGGATEGYRTQMALIPELEIGLFFSSMMYISTDDLFTMDALNVLIPAFESLFTQNQSKFDFNDDYLTNNTSAIDHPKITLSSSKSSYDSRESKKIEVPLSNYVGYYSSDEFEVLIQLEGSSLLVNISDPFLYYASRFNEDPNVLRIKYTDPTSVTCRFYNDGSNHELMYFTPDPNTPNQFSHLMVMGETVKLTSKDPTFITKQTNPTKKRRHRIN
eukprot:gene4350-5444_t